MDSAGEPTEERGEPTIVQRLKGDGQNWDRWWRVW